MRFNTPDFMKDFMGYDSFGNAPALVCEADKIKLEAGDYIRAGQTCACSLCGVQYLHHPHVQGALWLHRICDGTLVHL